MIKVWLLAAAALMSAGSAASLADEVAPLAGKAVFLDAASGVVYYTKEADGFRVVATLSASERAAPLRFIATLADGQTITVSVPVEAGKSERALAISRRGETLTVAEAEKLMVRASLD
ncbi:MAG: hypothetical protein H7Y08_09210 [Rhizobiaceae bacterium]|nr:hypothetical protein [Rhizobiaceae bacterium]